MVQILSIGKAAWQMAYDFHSRFALDEIGRIIVLTKYGFYPPAAPPLPKSILLEAGHPVPDENSLRHSQWTLDYLKNIPAHDTLYILISGGSSALFELPAEGYTLADSIRLNRLMLGSGLDIRQINLRRSEISAVKGGKALAYIKCKIGGLYLLSDVEGDAPAIIGSGAFYAPARVSDYKILGNIAGFMKGYARALKEVYAGPIRIYKGYISMNLDDFARDLRRVSKLGQPGIYLYGGELTLRPQGSGKGGRCSHLALKMAKYLSGKKGQQFLAYATDGNDNLPESAGAVVDGESWQKMIEAGIDVGTALKTYDSYPALKAIDAIIPGRYTGTNVNELYALWISDGTAQNEELRDVLLRYTPAFRF